MLDSWMRTLSPFSFSEGLPIAVPYWAPTLIKVCSRWFISYHWTQNPCKQGSIIHIEQTNKMLPTGVTGLRWQWNSGVWTGPRSAHHIPPPSGASDCSRTPFNISMLGDLPRGRAPQMHLISFLLILGQSLLQSIDMPASPWWPVHQKMSV